MDDWKAAAAKMDADERREAFASALTYLRKRASHLTMLALALTIAGYSAHELWVLSRPATHILASAVRSGKTYVVTGCREPEYSAPFVDHGTLGDGSSYCVNRSKRFMKYVPTYSGWALSPTLGDGPIDYFYAGPPNVVPTERRWHRWQGGGGMPRVSLAGHPRPVEKTPRTFYAFGCGRTDFVGWYAQVGTSNLFRKDDAHWAYNLDGKNSCFWSFGRKPGAFPVYTMTTDDPLLGGGWTATNRNDRSGAPPMIRTS